ncbi:hypothetical protein C8R30_1256 [Nitrosomonas nitrosa]|jgi:hypothetical protein|uniref:Uncharacterized protein n=1 Tax=Nitrosomonas nitrosa TaxID=52442 RepID=A0A1I4URX9_9PROT|nr:hypothetical protein C8R30_1256 [Nitrosomonas nitrosa]CAE6490811.1 hypothetical protein NMYAN_110003 [Nitrosomonas nitrosa]SFM91747.1 hypothetical protein SAMN05421880_1536 [Nitrosomonas nitrosa]
MIKIIEFFIILRDYLLYVREFHKPGHLREQHKIINVLVCGSDERYRELRSKYSDSF